jgi:hypothetical protein
METINMKSELTAEATASLQKQVEEELKVADPTNAEIAMAKIFNRALPQEEIEEEYGRG